MRIVPEDIEQSIPHGNLASSPRQRYHCGMDIQAISMDMTQGALFQQVGTSLLARSLGDAKEQGRELLKLMASATPAPLAAGTGANIDVFA